MQNCLDVLKRDAFAISVGIEITEVGEGRAVGKMKITDTHLNGVGHCTGRSSFYVSRLYLCSCSQFS